MGCLRVLLLFALVAAPGAGHAETVVLDAIDSGNCLISGCFGWDLTNENYATGQAFSAEIRSFLVFDLSAVSQEIQSAELVAYNPSVSVPGDLGDGFLSPSGSETVELYEMSTDLSLIDLPMAPAGLWDDLGDGTTYGTRACTAADNGTLVSFSLNAAALSDLEAATGLFGFGLTITTLDFAGPTEMMFSSTGSLASNTTRQLVLEVGPEEPPPHVGVPALGTLGVAVLVAALLAMGRGALRARAL